jgi:hypothetical protein
MVLAYWASGPEHKWKNYKSGSVKGIVGYKTISFMKNIKPYRQSVY